MLNIHLESVERLHQNRIYPIVLLVKFKSAKQIKEVKVPSSSSSSSSLVADRVSQKDAKNIFEHTQKLEAEYGHLISGERRLKRTSFFICCRVHNSCTTIPPAPFTDTIQAGANLMLMCAQITSKIDQEQNKTLWVPSGTIW